MKDTANSSVIEKIIRKKLPTVAIMTLMLAVGLLSGCDDVHMPSVFSASEVPEEIQKAPHAVNPPASEAGTNMAWPRLGDVPSKPKDFNPTMVTPTMVELQRERDEGKSLRQQIEESPVLPPPEDLRPPQLQH